MTQKLRGKLWGALAASLVSSAAFAGSHVDYASVPHPELDALIARYARMHGIPERLVHRVVMRESHYNPTALHLRYYGLMQITYPTAKSMGYKGPARGLLDAEVNLTYAVPYLANAYRAADGDETRAVGLYAGGYFFVAKRKKMLGQLRDATSASLEPPPPQAPVTEEPANPVAQLFQFVAGPQTNAAAERTLPAADPAVSSPQNVPASATSPQK
jgi:soluble lytic murein transglycosylase-like protein